MSLTVTRLAKSCNLSRSTVLYYESIGLLTQICSYRDAG
jgi:DNA-binding transcriptional MerR regulator